MPQPTAVIDIHVPPGPQAAGQAERIRGMASRHPFEVRIAGPEAASAERDALFVGAGVEIGAAAIDALADCAAREPGVATVSAFSNRARYARYPEAGATTLPQGESAASLAAAFARCNAGETVDLPLAEPALVYVTRAALERAGAIDAADDELVAFGMRAHAAGLRHLLCGEVFAFDPGPALAALPAEASAELGAVMDRDPARPLRRRVDLARLMASRRPRLLLVSHRWGGGVERHVNDVARIAGEVAEVLLLRPDGPRAVELAWLRAGESLRAWFAADHWGDLVALLRAVGISRLHFHHVHQLPRAVLDLPAELATPYDITLHDYFPICPRYHLSPAAGETCAGSMERCERCLEEKPAQWGLGLEEWRATFHGFLRRAARVIAPSHDCAARIRRYFPDVAVHEWPHPETPAAPPRIAKIALLGGVSAIKGARVLEACVADARDRRLPLHFHVIGHIDQPTATLPAAPLTVGGSYAEDELPLRIAIEKPDAILFLPQVAETYSYTLSAAMASGLPIVALALGALPERLRDYRRHALVPRDTPPAAINDALLELVQGAREAAPQAVAREAR